VSITATLVDGLLLDDIVDQSDVARVTGASGRSVARWTEGVTPRKAAEERLLELKTVVDLLRRVLRIDAARLWIHSPNPDFAYEKPLDLIARGEYRKVIGSVLAIAEGVTV
jgi:hypothetical protein